MVAIRSASVSPSKAIAVWNSTISLFITVMPRPLIIGLENRQGNSNVKFERVEELSRMLDNIEAHGLYVPIMQGWNLR